MVSDISFFILAVICTRSIFAKDPVHILYLTDCTRYSDWCVHQLLDLRLKMSPSIAITVDKP
jgi:hypothetical protein